MPDLLILTVGTGTSGKYSNLAQGLVNTLHQLAPRLFWLVPSVSPDSIAVADIVRESAPPASTFRPWSPTAPYRLIDAPDDLFDCRSTLRVVIQRARTELAADERLLVNPTSGTKQMSVGATLAALDEEVGDIVFTVGDRADGVVKTGTERMAPFSTRRFFLERDLAMAGELFGAGAFLAAARLLKSYQESVGVQAREKCRCLHEWQRMNYAAAATHASRFSEDLRRRLTSLAAADPYGAEILGDLLAGADELLRWGDAEEALARYYRGAELAAKVRLAQALDLRPPYRLGPLLERLSPSSPLKQELCSRSWNDAVQLGNELAWRLLDEYQDPMAAGWIRDDGLQSALRRRNESVYGHGRQPVEATAVQRVAARLRELLREHLPAASACWTTAHRPRSLT